LEKILELLVPSHLKSRKSVRAVVRSYFGELIGGRVAAVHLSGEAWHSRADLTARRLTVAALNGASLDYAELLAGRITLTTPAQGCAEAVFDSSDFGNFLQYRPVAKIAPLVCGQRLVFVKDSVRIDSPGRKVYFTGRVAGHTVKAVLDGPAGVDVAVQILDSPPAIDHGALAGSLTEFFRSLEVDLAGVRLRFHSIGFEQRSRCSLRLRATISRIPNPLFDVI